MGVGDTFVFSEVDQDNPNEVRARTVVISEKGTVNLMRIGRIKAEGLTQSQLEDEIYRKYAENAAGNPRFEIQINGFNSKRIFVAGEGVNSQTIPYTNVQIFLEMYFFE